MKIFSLSCLILSLAVFPGLSSAMEITEAMNLAVNNDAVVKSSEYATKASKTALIMGGLAPFLPSIEYDVSIINDMEQKLSNGMARNLSDLRTNTFTVSQSLFAGGADILGLSQASTLQKAASGKHLLTKQKVAIDAAKAYLDVLTTMEVEKLSEKQLQALSEYFRSIKKKFELGETTKTDVQQTEVRVSMAEAEKFKASGNVQIAKASYSRAIGVSPEGLLYPEKFPNIPSTLESMLDTARQQNLTLYVAHLNKTASDGGAGIAAARMLPTLSLSFSKTNRDEIDPLVNEEKVVSLYARFPIFQGGKNVSALAQALYKSRQGEYDYKETYDLLTEEIISEWNTFISSKLIVKASEKAVRAASTALDGIKHEAALNMRTNIDVLDAEREFFQAKVDLVNAKKSHFLSIYTISASIGTLLEYVNQN